MQYFEAMEFPDFKLTSVAISAAELSNNTFISWCQNGGPAHVTSVTILYMINPSPAAVYAAKTARFNNEGWVSGRASAVSCTGTAFKPV
jgi:hypothetical protein